MNSATKLYQTYEPRLRTTCHEKERIGILCQYAWELRLFDLKRSLELAEEAYCLAVSLSDKKGLAESLKTIGFCQCKSGQHASVILRLSEALEFYTEILDTENVIIYNNLLSESYYVTGAYTESLSFCLKSFDLCQKISNIHLRANTLNRIAINYIGLNEYDKAFKHLKECEAIYLAENNLTGLGAIYLNMGVIYNNWGFTEQSLAYFIQARDINFKLNNLPVLSMALANIGSVYTQLDNISAAIANLHQSLDLQQKIGQRSFIVSTHLNLGECYYKQQEHERAIWHLRQAILTGETLSIYQHAIKACTLLIKIYSELNDPEREFYWKEKCLQVESRIKIQENKTLI